MKATFTNLQSLTWPAQAMQNMPSTDTARFLEEQSSQINGPASPALRDAGGHTHSFPSAFGI